MATLLLADHDHVSVKDTTAKALTAALALGHPVHVLVAGHNAKAAADSASKLKGVDKVLLADDAAYANQLAEPVAALSVTIVGPGLLVLSTIGATEALPSLWLKFETNARLTKFCGMLELEHQ